MSGGVVQGGFTTNGTSSGTWRMQLSAGGNSPAAAAPPPAAATLPSGTYRVESVAGDRWVGTLRITVSGTRIQGQSEWDCCPGHRVDALSGTLTGNRIRWTRNCSGQGFNGPCDQVFEGVIEGKTAHGTLTMNGAQVGQWKFAIP
jgi:hypothetical protein